MSSIKFVDAQPFLHELKKLAKKYRSLLADVEDLKEELKKEPFQGADLGNGLRKVRMAIKSKGKGKSGGARVITYVEAITAQYEGTLIFLYIYDKSERSTITDKELSMLLDFLD